MFQGIADTLGEYLFTWLALYLAVDVPRVFRDLVEIGVLTLIPRSTLFAAAFLTTAEVRLAFAASLVATLAEVAGCRLLVGNDQTRAAFRDLRDWSPALRIVTVAELLRGNELR